MEKEKKRKEKKEKKKEKNMEDKQSGEQQHRSRTKPPAAAPASSHSTKRKTPAVGGDAQEAGDSFTELVEKAEAVTAFLTSMIQGSLAKSNAGKRELESPSPAQVKRLKSETVHAEADVDVLPGGLLAKVPLNNHCSLQIFPGPRVFLVHDVAGDAPETFAAGKEAAGFYGPSGAWWQKRGAKKDQQVTDVDMRFLLQDYSSMILHQGVYTSVGEVVDAKCLMVDKNCTSVVCVCLF